MTNQNNELRIGIINLFKISLVFIIAALSGCAYERHYQQVTSVETETFQGPEVRGASRHLDKDTGKLRIFGNIQKGTEGTVHRNVQNNIQNCNDLGGCYLKLQDEIEDKASITYKVEFPMVTGGFDYIRKWESVILGTGLTINSGLFGYISLGLNEEFYEIGGFLGIMGQQRKMNYSGTDYYCSYSYRSGDGYVLGKYNFSGSSSFGVTYVYGLYGAAYYNPFSLNYSVSFYEPDMSSIPDDVNANFELPLIITQYMTASFWVNEKIELRAGAINILGNFKGAHWAITGGFSYYPF